MRCLVPLFDCHLIKNEEICKLTKNVALIFDNFPMLIIDDDGNSYFITEKMVNCLSVEYLKDEYIFLFKKNNLISFVTEIKYLNMPIFIACGEKVMISSNSKVLIEKEVKVSFSHFEVLNNLCLIYFKGYRNFIVVLDKENVKCATFYDEFNRDKNEIYIMSKCYDSLNHGKVMHIKNGVFEDYLVYLDDYELNLKAEFVSNVFIDCVKCGNLKYANNLLSEELKQKDCNNIQNFFSPFDYPFFIEENICILLEKNTLSGVFKFEVENCKIANIIKIC